MSEQQGGAGDASIEVERAVLAYLGGHPEAADTLDGIITWWLPLQRYETERARIEYALTHLVALGVLRRDRLPDGAELYALSSDENRSPRAH